jgi:hypothetical protein
MKALAKIFNANKKALVTEKWFDDDNPAPAAKHWAATPLPLDLGIERGRIELQYLHDDMMLYWKFMHFIDKTKGHSGCGAMTLNFNIPFDQDRNVLPQIVIIVYTGLNPQVERQYVSFNVSDVPERPLISLSYDEIAVRAKANRKAKDGMNRLGPNSDPLSLGVTEGLHLAMVGLTRLKQGFQILRGINA